MWESASGTGEGWSGFAVRSAAESASPVHAREQSACELSMCSRSTSAESLCCVCCCVRRAPLRRSALRSLRSAAPHGCPDDRACARTLRLQRTHGTMHRDTAQL